LVLKLFRRQQAGTNPEQEVGTYLTEQVRFTRIAAVAGALEYTPDRGEPTTLALLQTFVPNQGDGWAWTLQELAGFYEACGHMPASGTTDHYPELDDRLAPYLTSVEALGRVTAELHLALATPSADPAFAPEPWTQDDLSRLAADMRAHGETTFESLKRTLPDLPDSVLESAGLALSHRPHLLSRFLAIASRPMVGQRIRVHGDYHLGQVLRIGDDFAVLDFEGEPARTQTERRLKHSPLKDVAGMLRSFSYAAWMGLAQGTHGDPEALSSLEPWARRWEHTVSAAFVRAYRAKAAGGAIVPADAVDFDTLLHAYVLDKAIYEVAYELNNRPAWVGIPLRGVLAYRRALAP
jgi:maltose alpha-D-glucosyltransferase/alpha-amylase